jgi:ribosomal protein S18 acetylase RimI-like enzyme
MSWNVGYASLQDLPWLMENDGYVSADWVERCINHQEYITVSEGNHNLGFLRFSLFWGEIPYMSLIMVKPDHQKRGIGTAMFNFWEQAMREKGAKVLLTSSDYDELDPQAWHKRNGFEACGQLTFGTFQPTPEIFFVKNLK